MSAQVNFARFAALAALAGGLLMAQPASAVMLVELQLNAADRGFGPDAPLDVKSQDFAIPSGPGTLIMTYTETPYVGGPGGFDLSEKRLSNERLGFGGECQYTPRDPIKGQPYRVRCTWLRDFSKKNWVASLVARYNTQNGRHQYAGRLTLNVEFVPGTPQDPAKPPGSAPAPATPPSVPPAPPAPPSAAPPAPVAPPAAPPRSPAPVAPPQPQPPAAAPPTSPVQPTPAPVAPVTPPTIRGSDSFDSTSVVHGDPFDGGEWRNARNGSASAVRVLAAPVCIAGLTLDGAGTDVDTAGSAIQIRLVGPSGAYTALDIRNAVVNRDFSPGPGGTVLPPQTRTFAPFTTTKIEVAMSGHGWFLLRGLKLRATPCP